VLGSGKSSLAIWTAFDDAVTSYFRKLRHSLKISWKRVKDDSTAFAIVGSSVVGGIDMVQGQETAVTEPDLYTYYDETENVVRIEYDRQLIEPFGGISMALMDIVLDNSDLRFTPDYNGTIGTALIPNRPINAHIGLELLGRGVTIPVFKGLTRTPKEHKSNRTVGINCLDYTKYLDEYTLDAGTYTNKRSDEIIEDILTNVGFGSTQFDLDTGLNTIGFAWFDKDKTAGARIRQVCEAEQAMFYQDEEGILRFETRRAPQLSPYNVKVWDIDPSDIILWEDDESSVIVNKCIVKANPREVQSLQVIWTDAQEEEILGGESITIWANFENPASSITTPVGTTDYTAYTGSGGTGSDITSDISIDISKFANDAKLVITNNNASKAYINFLQLRGKPAIVVGEILEVYEDTDSINKYGESQLTVQNNLIDTSSFAAYLAKVTVYKYSNPVRKIRLTVQGLPQIQLMDKVQVTDQDLDTSTDYRVMRIQGNLSGGVFTQTLYLREVTAFESEVWATIGTSVIDGTNIIGL